MRNLRLLLVPVITRVPVAAAVHLQQLRISLSAAAARLGNGRNRTFRRNYLQSGRFVNDFGFPNSWCYVIALSASLSRSH